MPTTSGPSNGVASYLPEIWSNDEAMQGYMSMIKARYVNAIDHDRKVKFWENVIDSYCYAEHNALVTLDLLKMKFRRGNELPAGLGTVMESMIQHGDLISLDEWKEKHSSWVGWGVSKLTKTSSWLFGGSGDSNLRNTRFIHVPTLKKQSEDVLKLYLDEFKSEVDCTGEVVAYSEFYDKANGIVKTLENFDVILEYMIDNGDVTVGCSRNGDKILKFKDVTRGSDSPVRFTEADASVHDIRKAMTKVERDISVLEQKVKKLDVSCREALRSGQKTRAASFLRQKKRVEKDISDKDGQLQGLLTMLHQLSSTKLNKEVLDAYKMGSDAFKANLARHGLSPDKVDKTMDEITSSLDDYRELEDAMGQGFGLRSKDQDEDLERELDNLLADQKKEEQIAAPLPDVPSRSFGLTPEREDSLMDDGSLEKRLQRLREAV